MFKVVLFWFNETIISPFEKKYQNLNKFIKTKAKHIEKLTAYCSLRHLR